MARFVYTPCTNAWSPTELASSGVHGCTSRIYSFHAGMPYTRLQCCSQSVWVHSMYTCLSNQLVRTKATREKFAAWKAWTDHRLDCEISTIQWPHAGSTHAGSDDGYGGVWIEPKTSFLLYESRYDLRSGKKSNGNGHRRGELLAGQQCFKTMCSRVKRWREECVSFPWRWSNHSDEVSPKRWWSVLAGWRNQVTEQLFVQLP